MRVLAFAPLCNPQPSVSTTTSPSTLSTTSASAAPSSVASVNRAPATGIPTASRCTTLIPRSMRPVTPRRASPLRVRGGPFHPLRRDPPSVGVPGDDVLAREQRNHAAEREERAEREVHLASTQPLARE